MRSTTLIGCALAAALAATACPSLEPVTLDQLTALRPQAKADQSTVVVESPRVDQGRLLGFVDRNYQAMPLGDVRQVLVAQPARGRTAEVIAGTTLGLVALGYLLSDVGHHSSQFECNPDVGDGGCINGN